MEALGSCPTTCPSPTFSSRFRLGWNPKPRWRTLIDESLVLDTSRPESRHNGRLLFRDPSHPLLRCFRRQPRDATSHQAGTYLVAFHWP